MTYGVLMRYVRGLRNLSLNKSTLFTELSVRELYMVPGVWQPRQQPPPMEPRTSSPAITWKKWRQRFEIYMTGAGKTEANDDVKTSLPLHAIGPEGIEIFNTFTFTEEEEGIPSTRQRCRSFRCILCRKSTLRMKDIFFTRNRQVGESIDKTM